MSANSIRSMGQAGIDREAAIATPALADTERNGDIQSTARVTMLNMELGTQDNR
jgi:hypothetical protein